MPEVLFSVQLPGGEVKRCYSPSTIVHNYFSENEEMTVAEFLRRSRKALAEASERVAAKYGFACSSALDQLAEIEKFTRPLSPEGTVRILSL